MERIVNANVEKQQKFRRKGIKGPVAQTVLWIILGISIFLLVMPLIITFMYSLKMPSEHITGTVWSIPANPQWKYYIEAFNALVPSTLSTLIVCVITTFGVIAFSSITAYVFSRHNFVGKELVFSLIIALMMVPSILTMTPSYLITEKLGLLNTRWALILPGIAGGQVGAIFLFRTFFTQQPAAIFESATLDGANDIQMYLLITLPLAVPVLIIQALGTFSLMYNDFLWPQLVVKDEEMRTLMPTLKYLAEQKKTAHPGISYAMYLLAGVPLIAVSLFGLKYFVSGDFASGMKL